MPVVEIPRCAFVHARSFRSWHWSQTWLICAVSSFGWVEKWGLWQVEQSFTGACVTPEASFSLSFVWQARQLPGVGASCSALSPAECGLWQLVHLPPEKAACTLFAWASAAKVFAWQRPQSARSSAARSEVVFEPCASWQARQSPFPNGAWAVLPAGSFISSAWQLSHSLAPLALSIFGASDECPTWQRSH